MKKLDISPDSSEFIFRPLVKAKSSYKLVQVDKHISYVTLQGQLTKSLQSIVPDPSVFGTHSFRSGEASRAANSGVSDRVFQRHGRWKSVAGKDGKGRKGRHVFTSCSLEIFRTLVSFLFRVQSSPILFLLGHGCITYCYTCGARPIQP